jgi:protein TonB
LSVSLPYPLVDQLEREAVESFRSISSRGSEIGGLLFGTVEAGSPLLVRVESCEAVDCDYSGGPLYHLTDAELARLDRAIEQRLAAGIRAVGFYRSHTRKGLALTPEDVALFESRFREPHHVALLIRPAATKASVAGFFIREDGKVRGDATPLEFPFRSSQHNSKRLDSLYDGAVAGPRSVTAAPAAPRPSARAQIVPIASRREMIPEPPAADPATFEAPAMPAPPALVLSAPAPVEPELPPVVAAPPVEAAPAPVIPAPQAAPVTPAPVQSAPVATPVVPAPPVAAPKPPVVSAPVSKSPAPVEEPLPPVKAGSSKLLWIGLGALVPVVLLIGFFFSSGMLHRGKPSIPGAGQDTSALALRVERNGADIVLTWNRDSDVIKRATRAMLSISDGPQHENVAMDLSQLRNVGSIVYSPVTGDVVFQMEVTGADEAKTVSESVRVLRTKPSPMSDTPAGQTPAPVENAGAAPADAGAQAAEDEKPVALAQATKAFHAEPLAQRLHASAAEMPDTPVLAVPAAAGNVNLGSLVSSQSAPPPQAAAAIPAASPAPVASSKLPGGDVRQAQLISRTDPEYPKLARDSGASGIVELMATVGVDGKVRAVTVVRGHPLLRQAAVDAVKRWVYRPTMLNGTAVETQTQVILTFKGTR